uniref:Uncharacterized protein n=1 Tax=Amphimedon queenslandica TaxID=400682 RepID=A0A1X7U985_AMPQE
MQEQAKKIDYIQEQLDQTISLTDMATQLLYNRRENVLKGKERDYWKQISYQYMSLESSDDYDDDEG